MKCVAVFVGPSGIGPWQDVEVDDFLDECSKRDLPIIPVLLPGATKGDRIPIFLKERTWVDFSKLETAPFDKLFDGIVQTP